MHDDEVWSETLVEQTVTYHIEIDGRLYLVAMYPPGSMSRRAKNTSLQKPSNVYSG